jgi:phosphomannomutase
MIEKLKEKFGYLPLQYSIGAISSFDVFPISWDKTYCLQFLTHINTIYFFADKPEKVNSVNYLIILQGCNDHELFYNDRIVGFQVYSWRQTLFMLQQMFNL